VPDTTVPLTVQRCKLWSVVDRACCGPTQASHSMRAAADVLTYRVGPMDASRFRTFPICLRYSGPLVAVYDARYRLDSCAEEKLPGPNP
jgi:hypothetical protein